MLLKWLQWGGTFANEASLKQVLGPQSFFVFSSPENSKPETEFASQELCREAVEALPFNFAKWWLVTPSFVSEVIFQDPFCVDSFEPKGEATKMLPKLYQRGRWTRKIMPSEQMICCYHRIPRQRRRGQKPAWCISFCDQMWKSQSCHSLSDFNFGNLKARTLKSQNNTVECESLANLIPCLNYGLWLRHHHTIRA